MLNNVFNILHVVIQKIRYFFICVVQGKNEILHTHTQKIILPFPNWPKTTKIMVALTFFNLS